MKILHLDDRFSAQGGVGQYILVLVDLLGRHGHESVVTYRDPNTTPCTSVRAYLLSAGDEAEVAALRQIVSREQPDVALIHHVSSPNLIRALAAQLPTVVYVHGFLAVCPGLAKYYRRGDQVCEQPFGWRCFLWNYSRRCSSARHPATMLRLMKNTAGLKAAYQSVAQLVVGSRYMRALLVQNGFDAANIAVLPPHFVAPKALPRFTPAPDPTRVLFAGRLEIEKGLPHLLKAMALLPPSLTLVVAGDGTQGNAYRQLVASLGLTGRVTFAGWQDEDSMRNLYQTSSIIVIPSLCPESYGKVGVEALAHGRPVVAYGVGGIRDWLTEGVTGRLVAPASVEALARAIADLSANPALCERMGRNGQQYVRGNLSADAHLAGILAVFGRAIRG